MAAEKKRVTVKELIATLSTHNPDAPVILEGCDCHGEASGEVDEIDHNVFDGDWKTPSVSKAAVLLRRND